jgi:type IV secretory pathway TrbL component
MERLLITTHMHVLALMLGVIAVPLIVGFFRKRKQKTAFSKEENNKLRLDVAVIIPVGVLLWNLSIFYLVNIFRPTTPNVAATLTFEKAVAAAGEATVALATAIIFCRLFGDIWDDIRK